MLFEVGEFGELVVFGEGVTRGVVAAVRADHKVRYYPPADLAETLYRGLAGNSVGRVIDPLLRNDLVLVDEVGCAPLDDTGAQLLFRIVAAAYERRSLGIASQWPYESWGRFLPEHTTAVSLLNWLLHHADVVITEGSSYRMREALGQWRNHMNKRSGKTNSAQVKIPDPAYQAAS